MKKILYVIIALSLFAGNIFAQPCGTPGGPSVCTAVGLSQPGLRPRTDSIPPVRNGIADSIIIQLKNFNTIPFGPLTLTVQSLRVDSVENLPSGMCWSTDKANNTYGNQEDGCIKISGTPCSRPGSYKLRIWVYVVTNLGAQLQNASDPPANIKYFIRVGNLHDVVPPCDTLQTVSLDTVGYSLTANCSPTLCPHFTFPTPTVGTNTSCSAPNGTIDVSATGGTAPYTYYLGAANNLTGHFTGISGGAHNVVAVDANACRDSVSVTVPTTTPTITVTPVSSTPQSSCTLANGGLTVSASGGSGAYTYAIGTNTNSTGIFSGLASGSYTISATDANSCSGNLTTAVANTAPVLTVTKVSDTAQTRCVGHNGAVVVTASAGQSPYTYSILLVDTNTTGVFTGMAGGAYVVNVSDANSCHGTYNGSITQTLATVTVTVAKTNASSATATNGTATATAGGGTGPYTYAWTGSSQTSAAITGLAPGTYSVTVTDAKACSATGSAIVSFNSGMNSLATEITDLQIFPNPAAENITVHARLVSAKDVTIEILNLLGEKVRSRNVGLTDNISENFSLKGLAKGAYFIKINAGEKLAAYPIAIE